MKKILLPTDFSDNAWNAIVYALQFFKNETCRFYVLHTYTPTFYRLDYMMGGPTFSAIPDMGVDLAQAGLDKTLADIKKAHKNPKHHYRMLSAFNTLTDEIREVTDREGINLVVMGTQGVSGAMEVLIGTHTIHVLRKSNIPILVIPTGYAFREIKSVLFPSDFAIPFQQNDLKSLVELIKIINAELTVLNVKNDYELTVDQKKNVNSLKTRFKELQPKFEQVKGKLMPDAIPEYIERHHIGLLAMMNRKHSFLERLLVKSSVDYIGYHTKIPFLVMPDTSDEITKENKR